MVLDKPMFTEEELTNQPGINASPKKTHDSAYMPPSEQFSSLRPSNPLYASGIDNAESSSASINDYSGIISSSGVSGPAMNNSDSVFVYSDSILAGSGSSSKKKIKIEYDEEEKKKKYDNLLNINSLLDSTNGVAIFPDDNFFFPSGRVVPLMPLDFGLPTFDYPDASIGLESYVLDLTNAVIAYGIDNIVDSYRSYKESVKDGRNALNPFKGYFEKYSYLSESKMEKLADAFMESLYNKDSKLYRLLSKYGESGNDDMDISVGYIDADQYFKDMDLLSKAESRLREKAPYESSSEGLYDDLNKLKESNAFYENLEEIADDLLVGYFSEDREGKTTFEITKASELGGLGLENDTLAIGIYLGPRGSAEQYMDMNSPAKSASYSDTMDRHAESITPYGNAYDISGAQTSDSSSSTAASSSSSD